MNRLSALQAIDDAQVHSTLKGRFVQGRLRTDRATPSANSNVVGDDRLGDIVRTAAYEYIVVDDSGTLKWARQALDVSW